MPAMLIHVLFVIIVVAILLAVAAQIPMDDWLKRVIRIIGIGVIAIVLIWALFTLIPLT